MPYQKLDRILHKQVRKLSSLVPAYVYIYNYTYDFITYDYVYAMYVYSIYINRGVPSNRGSWSIFLLPGDLYIAILGRYGDNKDTFINFPQAVPKARLETNSCPPKLAEAMAKATTAISSSSSW